MTQVEFLEKLWLSYKKMCKEKCIEIGTKERFMDAQQPKRYSTDTLLITQKSTSLMIKQHAPDICKRDKHKVEKLPLFKIHKDNDFILTRSELRKIIEDAIQRGYKLGKEEVA